MGFYNLFVLMRSNVDQQIGKEFLEQYARARVRHGVLVEEGDSERSAIIDMDQAAFAPQGPS